MTLPVAVISFNRPGYLAQVLDSLKRQTVHIPQIALFQDGPRKKSDELLIRNCMALFRSKFRHGEVYDSSVNLGPGLNIERAENWLFEPGDAAAGAIFEDDMVLSPVYLEVLRAMLAANLKDDRIAYVSAYGSILSDSRSDAVYAPMHLNWGFALTRHMWVLRKPLVDAYLSILRGHDYRTRDIVAIMKLREIWGFPGPTTTQDVMRALATHKVGGIRLGTKDHFGRYIGAQGLHIDQRTYDAAGFAKWPLNSVVPRFTKVSEDMVRRCRALTEEFACLNTGSAVA